MPVDALTPTWINAPDDVSGPAYDAETLRRDFGGLVAAGATAAVARSGVLDPRALTPSLSGQDVQVGPGPCVAGTGKGAYFSGAATVLTVDTLTPADTTNPRRDRLVFEVLDPDNGGSTARKARFRLITGKPDPQALTGGGYPADPGAADGVSTFFNIADIDMPKNGTGNPTITDRRPFTAAAGAPIPVRNKAEREQLPKWKGATCSRLDRNGSIEFCDGAVWSPVPTAPHMEFTYNTAASAIPNGVAWGPGTLSVDNSAVSNDTSLASSPSDDMLNLNIGTYDLWFGGAFGHGLTGPSWFQVKSGDDKNVLASSPANEFWGCVSIQGLVVTADNTQFRLRLKASIAGDANARTNSSGRVRVTRRG